MAVPGCAVARLPAEKFPYHEQCHFCSMLQGMIGADCPSPETADCQYNPITVFSPTNSAFQRLARSLNVTVAELLDLPQV